MTNSTGASKKSVKIKIHALSDSFFLGKRSDQLSMLIEQQVIPIFEDIGIVVPVRSCSLVVVLAELTFASAADLARQLDQSHQLVLQKIPALERLKLLRRQNDPNDKRRKVFQLTSEGHQQLELINKHIRLIEQAYEKLNAELGVDVFAVLGRAIEALKAKDLSTRIDEIAK
ncbi:MAG: MarR family winged helix-turn-helix transcriptional regulator [Calditrichia bacterium]